MELLTQDPHSQDTLCDQIERFLDHTDIKQVVGMLAYASGWASHALLDSLKHLGPKVDLIVGARNGTTSKQAIDGLMEAGCTVHLFDTGTPGILFHPKAWVRVGTHESSVLIGSGNFTESGLSHNFEVNFLLSGTHNDEAFMAERNKLLAYHRHVLTSFSANCLPVLDQTDTAALVEMGWLVDANSLAHKRARQEARLTNVATEAYAAPALRRRNTARTIPNDPTSAAHTRKKRRISTTLRTVRTIDSSYLHEKDFYLPIVEELITTQTHCLQVDVLKGILGAKLRLSNKDKEHHTSTGMPRHKKIFDNVISHRGTRSNPIARGWIAYSPQSATLELTPKGVLAYQNGDV